MGSDSNTVTFAELQAKHVCLLNKPWRPSNSRSLQFDGLRCKMFTTLSDQEAAMKELEERILRDGKSLGGGILKVDSFVNHQVDPLLMDACGREFARLFAGVGATKVLTAEISGIAPALTTAIHLGLPVVYARKHKPITMPDQVYLTLAPSHTKGRMVELIVSPEYLANGEKVLIIDDFLASGQTILGLVRLAEASGAKIVGIGALIEKVFEGGREALKPLGVPIHSLACITSMEGDRIVFGQPE
jgi:xanthine phosphoribosyltransferase